MCNGSGTVKIISQAFLDAAILEYSIDIIYRGEAFSCKHLYTLYLTVLSNFEGTCREETGMS